MAEHAPHGGDAVGDVQEQHIVDEAGRRIGRRHVAVHLGQPGHEELAGAVDDLRPVGQLGHRSRFRIEPILPSLTTTFCFSATFGEVMEMTFTFRNTIVWPSDGRAKSRASKRSVDACGSLRATETRELFTRGFV